jgi:hypothetical protein
MKGCREIVRECQSRGTEGSFTHADGYLSFCGEQFWGEGSSGVVDSQESRRSLSLQGCSARDVEAYSFPNFFKPD